VTVVIAALVVLIGGALAPGVLATSGQGGLFDRQPGARPSFQIVPAAELPTTQPNVRGVVAQRAASTIAIAERAGLGPNEAPGTSAPQVEAAVVLHPPPSHGELDPQREASLDPRLADFTRRREINSETVRHRQSRRKGT
jgi:hypothetical protein